MIEASNAALIAAGTCILTFRLFTDKPTEGSKTEFFLNICMGLSWIMLAPMFLGFGIWQPLVFAVVGVTIGTCHNIGVNFVAGSSIGAVVGTAVWQIGLCTDDDSWNLHPLVLAVTIFLSVFLHMCTPLAKYWHRTGTPLWPTELAAMMLAWGILNPRALWKVECMSGDDDSTALQFLALWLLNFACGVGLLVIMLKRKIASMQEEGRLADNLLPGKHGEGGGAGLVDGIRPAEASGHMIGYAKLRDAIFNEDADMSHFSENEKKIVEVCRKDEFERDRLLWGGGLI